MADNDKVGGPQIEIGFDIKDAKAGAKDLGKSLDDTTKSAIKMGEGISTSERAVGSLVRTLKNLGSEVAQKKIDNLSVAVEKLGGTSKMTGAQIEFLQTRLEKLQAAGAKVPANLQDIASASNKIRDAVSKLGAQQLGGLNNQLGGLGSVLGAIGPGGLAVGAALGTIAAAATAVYEAIKVSSKELAEYGIKVAFLQAETGLTAKTSQEMAISTEVLGGNAKLTGQMLARLQSSIEDNNPALKRLGLDFQELKRMSPDEQLRSVIDALDKVGNATERIDIERKLFGRGGAQISLLLENLKSVSDFAERAGLVMSDEDVSAAKDLAIAGGELEQAWKGVEREFAAGFLNGTDLRSVLEEMAPEIRALGELARGTGSVLSVMWGVAGGQEARRGLSVIHSYLEDVGTFWGKKIFGNFDEDLPSSPGAPSLTPGGVKPKDNTAEDRKRQEQQDAEHMRQLHKDESDSRRADNEFLRESIRLNEELGKALFKQKDGLEATIGAIRARHDAERSKYTSEEATYTPEQVTTLVDLSKKTEAAEVAAARLAAAHRSAQIAAGLQADAEKLLSGMLESGMGPLGVSIAGIEREHTARVKQIGITLQNAALKGELTPQVMAAALADLKAAQAVETGAKAEKIASTIRKDSVEVTKMEHKANLELAQARAKGSQSLSLEIAAIDEKIAGQKEAVDATIEQLKLDKKAVEGDDAKAASIQSLIDTLEKLKGTYDEVAESLKKTASLNSFAQTLTNISSTIGTAASALKSFDLISDKTAADIGYVQQGLGGLSSIAKGLASDNPFEVIAGGINLLSGVAHLFGGKAEWEKIGDDLGAAFGSHWTEATAKAIADTEKKLNVSRRAAELLSLDKIMEDNPGMDPAKWRSQMQDLAFGIAHGLVPAQLGVQALCKDFTMLKDAADNGSIESEKAMIQLIHTAKQLGVVVPEIQDALKGFVKEAVDNLKDLYAGQNSKFGGKDHKELIGGQVSAEQAAANQTIFGAVFEADVALNGLVAAADDTKDAFDNLTRGLPDGTDLTGGAAAAGIVNKALENPLFRGAATSAAAGAKVLAGLEKGDFINQKTTDAFGVTLKNGIDQAFKGTEGLGLSDSERNKLADEANLPLLTQMQHAEASGAHLSDETKAELQRARNEGLLPMKTLAEQQLEVLKQIRDKRTGDENNGGGNPSTPGSPGSPGGNNTPGPLPPGAGEHGVTIPHYAEGGKLPAHPPYGRVYIGGEKEDEFIFRGSQLKDMKRSNGDTSFHVGGVTVVAAPGQNPREVADAVADAIERRLHPRLATLLRENSR